MRTLLRIGGAGLATLVFGACLNFDQRGGAREAFCAERPDLCSGSVGDPTMPPPTSGGGDGGGGGGGGGGGTPAVTACPEFDPGGLYMQGSLWLTLSSGSAISTFEDTRALCIGTRGVDLVIRPTDRKLLYLDRYSDPHAIRVLVPDAFEIDRQEPQYPEDPAANDPVVFSDAFCDDVGILGFTIWPDDGEVVYRCFGGDQSQWFDASGNPLPGPKGTYITLGKNRVRLVGSTLVVSIDGSFEHVYGYQQDETSLIATRARPDGFWVVRSTDEWSAKLRLYHVAFSGAATLLVEWDRGPVELSGYGQLVANGDLYMWAPAGLREDPQDRVFRFPFAGGVAELYFTDEGQSTGELVNAIVKNRGFAFISGPGEVD